MKQVELASVARCGLEPLLRTHVFQGERLDAHLLCMAAGQGVPSHRHEGCEVMLLPLRGEAEITLDGQAVRLRAGEVVFVDGANDFAPVNPGPEDFAMLAVLVRK